MEEIGLAEVIAALHQELSDSIAAAKDAEVKFRLGEVTLELELAVERTKEGNGGLRFWVLEVGGERSTSRARTHRITVPMTVVDANGNTVYTGENAIPGE